MKKKIVLEVIFLSFLFSCGKSEIDRLVDIPEDFQPSYTVAEVNDVSYAAALRKSVKITVAKGMSETNISLNMKAAVKHYYGQFKPDAISVMAYFEGTNINSAYDAGVCEFAPGGDWGKAKKGTPLSQFRCNIKTVKPKQKPKQAVIAATAKEYKIDLKVQKLAGRKIKVDIDTNFPNGTILWFWVFREYDKEYAGEIFNKDVTVGKTKMSFTVPVNDRKWYGEYLEKQRTMGKELFNDIKTIAEKVTVTVRYATPKKQPENVLAILGNKGQFIKGEGAKPYGNEIIFEKEVLVNIPFEK